MSSPSSPAPPAAAPSAPASAALATGSSTSPATATATATATAAPVAAAPVAAAPVAAAPAAATPAAATPAAAVTPAASPTVTPIVAAPADHQDPMEHVPPPAPTSESPAPSSAPAPAPSSPSPSPAVEPPSLPAPDSDSASAVPSASDAPASPAAQPAPKRARRASAKSAAVAAAIRALRPRSASRSAGDPDDTTVPEAAATGIVHIPPRDTAAQTPPVQSDDQEEDAQNAETPRPVLTEKGLSMTVGAAVFVTHDQLENLKQHRMRAKGLRPIEQLTFDDILSYNRDQLRCYCFIYGTPRKKKSEMEVDMARFVSLWNEGKPGFVFADYVPKNTTPHKHGSSPLPQASSADDADKAGNNSSSRLSRRPSTQSAKASGSSASTTPIKQESSASADRDSAMGRTASAARATTTPSKPPTKAPPKVAPKSGTKSTTKTPVRGVARPSGSASASTMSPASAMPPTSAKRPPPRPTNIQPSPIRPNLPPRPPSAERSVAPGRASPGLLLPNHAPVSIQPAGSASGRNSSGSSSKSNRPVVPIQPIPKGFGTSHKQKVHARTAGSKFKAAFNGAGPAIVNIVENAAAYFEGKDSADVIADRDKACERYQFNVDLLSEIFDGPPPDSQEQMEEEDVTMKDVEGSDLKAKLTRDIAKRMRSRNSAELVADMKLWEENYSKLETVTKETERTNMRLFQRLERAEREEEIEAVKRDFEEEHDTRLPCAPPPLVRRKLDKSLAPVLMPDDKCHILRFKVA